MDRESVNMDLISTLTDDLMYADCGTEIVFAHSETAKDIIDKGKNIIPEIGTYLKDLDDLLKNRGEDEVENAKQGWAMLITEIIEKENISEGRAIFGGNFKKHAEWAYNFKP